jgi:hypothetical protein
MEDGRVVRSLSRRHLGLLEKDVHVTQTRLQAPSAAVLDTRTQPAGGGECPSPGGIDLSVIYQVEGSKLLTFLALALASFLPQIELLIALTIGGAAHAPPLPLTLLLVVVSDLLTIYFALGAVVRYDLLAAIEAKHTYSQVNELVAADPTKPRADAHLLARTFLSWEQVWFTLRYRWLLPLLGIPALVLIVSGEILRYSIWGAG